MKVRVDADVCVGTGSCINICPDVFELGDDGVAVVKVAEVPAELEESCREAVDGCPVEAILLED